MKQFFVYIMTNKNNTVLYIGVTNSLQRRVKEHRDKKRLGFTQKYNCSKLVHFEETDTIHAALNHEKQLKNWHREWKENLITEINPKWDDLSNTFGLHCEAERGDPETSSGCLLRFYFMLIFISHKFYEQKSYSL